MDSFIQRGVIFLLYLVEKVIREIDDSTIRHIERMIQGESNKVNMMNVHKNTHDKLLIDITRVGVNMEENFYELI